MHIDIYADTICPWCFIGKRRLERALAERPQPDVQLRWRAFQLNPDIPAEGMDRQDYLIRKFGGVETARQVYAAIRDAGDAEGLPFAFNRIERTPNSLASHRLLRFAAERGAQGPLVEQLFRLYFLQGADIGETDVLVEAAAEAGFDAAEARRYLETGMGLAETQAEDLQARRAGIQGVPTFVFNGHSLLSGAHEPKVLFQMFDLAREERGAAE